MLGSNSSNNNKKKKKKNDNRLIMIYLSLSLVSYLFAGTDATMEIMNGTMVEHFEEYHTCAWIQHLFCCCPVRFLPVAMHSVMLCYVMLCYVMVMLML